MKFFLRWLITAVAVFLTSWLLPNIRIEDSNGFVAVAIVALILGFLNAIIRPILTFLSCGCIVATMGLFMFIINAFILWLTAYIAQNLFGVAFYVDSIWAALLGSIVISIISFVLSIFLLDD